MILYVDIRLSATRHATAQKDMNLQLSQTVSLYRLRLSRNCMWSVCVPITELQLCRSR